MIATRSLTACALLLAIGCTPKEWDSGSTSKESQKPPGRGQTAKTANGSEHLPARPEIASGAVVQKAKETFELTGELIAQTKEEFLAKAKQRLAEMDRQLDEWETRSKPLSEEARAKLDHDREVFRQRRTEMQQELDRLTGAGDDAWQDMKAGTAKVWSDLTDAFGKAATHFESGRVP
ncbi:MAG TPA: hypothetical protein VGM05_25955 [Planctomycetaceae bacterium]|jgi:uncharacterized protein YfiM (DUF2279 family)